MGPLPCLILKEELGKMKHIITSICLGFAVIFTASAQEKHQSDSDRPIAHRGNARASSETAAPARMTSQTTARPAATQRRVSTAPFRQRTYAETPRTNANATVRNRTTANARVRTDNARMTSRNRVQNNVAVNRERNFGANRQRTNRDERNFAANRDRNMRFNQRSNEGINRNRNAVVTNNWHGNQFSGRQYAVFRNYHRQWHDQDWWHHHFTRIVFVDGGWWFWNAGYWFPAWGYDSSAYYPYDGPIYGYGNLTPGQVVVQVQSQLQSDGYYSGPIDGVLGPMTRQAIAAFQADNNLAITSTVDEPTLNTLGVS